MASPSEHVELEEMPPESLVERQVDNQDDGDNEDAQDDRPEGRQVADQYTGDGVWKAFATVEDLEAKNKSRKDSNASAAAAECFVYLIFMSVFSVTIHVNKPNEQFYQMNRALRMLILDNEFEFDTFANWGIRGMEHVVRTEEAWAAIYDIIIPNIMDSGIHESPEGTVHGVNFMLGGMRLRQIRVNSVNCTSKLLDQTGKPTAIWFQGDDLTGGDHTRICQPFYSSDVEEKKPYGPNGEWIWTEGAAYPFEYWGVVASYGKTGYIQDLGKDADQAIARVKELQAQGWIDAQTRLVVIDVPLYNANIGM